MSSSLESIYNYLRLSERVATAGQPHAAQFPAVPAAGFQTVINLLHPSSSEYLPQEAQLWQELGVNYIAIPVEWNNPTLEDFRRFVVAMQAHAQEPVFVHCAANMRVSAFMYLYRTLLENVPPETAEEDLHRLWVPNPIWEQFIAQVEEETVAEPVVKESRP